MATQTITCKTCDSGSMYSTKIHRLSGPSVIIGYLLLIPSAIGIMIAAGIAILAIAGAASVASAPSVDESSVALKLEKAGIDDALAKDIMSLQTSLDDDKLDGLTEDQKRIAMEAQSEMVLGSAGATAAAGLGGAAVVGLSGMFAVACFISGLIGWLLTMKKKVLQCSTCRATVGAG